MNDIQLRPLNFMRFSAGGEWHFPETAPEETVAAYGTYWYMTPNDFFLLNGENRKQGWRIVANHQLQLTYPHVYREFEGSDLKNIYFPTRQASLKSLEAFLSAI